MLSDEKNSLQGLLGNRGGSQISVNNSPAPPASVTPTVNNEKISQYEQPPRRKSKKRDKDDDTQFTTILKVLNILIGLGVVAFGVSCYKFFNTTTESLQFVGIILPGYIAFSGLLIVLIQCNIKFIVRNMKFLYSYIGRGLFNIYVGVMPLSMIRMDAKPEQDKMFQVVIFIMVSLMVLIGLLYILAKIFCCAKQGNKRRRRHSESQSDDD